jgi:hypothetical protein
MIKVKLTKDSSTRNIFFYDKRLKMMLLISLLIIIVALVLRLFEFAYGVIAATPVSIFNYWIMFDALKKGEKMPLKASNKMFIGRYIIRMAISLVALILAVQIGIYFVFGVLTGLLLHLFTYSTDIWKILRGGK